ncbi:MAG TPA: UDP-N-acetylmuramate--L-alanine ligase [Candidatus Paceibacterota bacterium]|nr:UDP-N-acetylmuramate--L-alanine ligase [Candidatus Paceibacterota bacterium]HRZ34426.1 UDP-N-acetylmuramate--L-alanine ligase [Candidatus Paceibacterota bacterium]
MEHIFFIGIGGKGLNGIAKVCLEKGYKVSGVDVCDKPETIALAGLGAKIFYGHKESNISPEINLIVYSSLIKENCPEIIAARRLNIKTMKRSAFLGFLARDDFRISIAGSHGKSTTTALVGLSLINSNVDATIFGGAYTKELGSYNHLGKSGHSVIEACEYDRSFFDLTADISVITSIEKSHLEYYKDEGEMVEAFREFIHLHKPNALIIANGDDSNIRRVTSHIAQKVIYFGFDVRNDYVIGDVLKTKLGSTFSIFKNSKKILNNLTINLPGTYNILNFTATATVLRELGISLEGVIETAKHFTGVGRRFEMTRLNTGQIFIDDFAHHPTQVKNLFDGIQQFFGEKKVCAIFQPRQYNLMKNFLTEYGKAFSGADEVILTDIVPGLGDTEADCLSVNSHQIAESIIKNSGRPARIMNDFSQITQYVKSNYAGDSVVTTIGAGDIYKIRNLFAEK